jgi:type I restriction enzyme, S subunit
MSDKITKSPQIRFVGFTDAWEQCKLGDLGSVAMNKRIFKDETTEAGDVPFYKIGTFGGEPDAFISREVFEEYKVKYPYPEVGDILISASGSIGKTVVYQGEDEYFQDSNIVWLKHDERLDNSFLKQFYSIVKWQGLEGSTIKRLYNKNVLDTDISVPAPDEQKMIGKFFGQIDNLITLHQRKLELLKETKKSLLQKTFPKDGANVPEIRFAEFTNAWEQRAFSELVTRVSKSSEVDELPRVEYEDIVSGQGELNKDIFAKESDKKGIEFEVGDTLFGKLRPYLQNWLLADFKGIAVGDWWVLRPNEMDNKFIYSLIQSSKYQTVSNLATGTKMPRSDWNVVSQTEFSVPTDKGEQAKIGQFFDQLDHLITLHQRELISLENLKKSLLQQMFI